AIGGNPRSDFGFWTQSRDDSPRQTRVSLPQPWLIFPFAVGATKRHAKNPHRPAKEVAPRDSARRLFRSPQTSPEAVGTTKSLRRRLARPSRVLLWSLRLPLQKSQRRMVPREFSAPLAPEACMPSPPRRSGGVPHERCRANSTQ